MDATKGSQAQVILPVCYPRGFPVVAGVPSSQRLWGIQLTPARKRLQLDISEQYKEEPHIHMLLMALHVPRFGWCLPCRGHWWPVIHRETVTAECRLYQELFSSPTLQKETEKWGQERRGLHFLNTPSPLCWSLAVTFGRKILKSILVMNWSFKMCWTRSNFLIPKSDQKAMGYSWGVNYFSQVSFMFFIEV